MIRFFNSKIEKQKDVSSGKWPHRINFKTETWIKVQNKTKR